MTITRVNVKPPALGGKVYFINTCGFFVLEEGPAVLRSFNITHAGSGVIRVYDGVVDSNGFFPDSDMLPDNPNYNMRNGRVIYQAAPAILQAWMLDAGVNHGITIEITGGTHAIAPMATVVWLKHTSKK